MICSLRPGYEPPNRKLIANELLEKVHEEVTHSINSAMKQTSKVLTVMQDGWSSCSNDPILAHSVHDGENSTLISVVDCKAEKKTAEYCLEKICEAIDHLKVTKNKEVFAVVTDNEAKMNKMKMLLVQKHPKMVVYGWSAHYMNLLESEVSHPAVLKHIIEVQKFFRKKHQAHVSYQYILNIAYIITKLQIFTLSGNNDFIGDLFFHILIS